MASTSLPFQKHHQPDIPSKVKVTILASEWGSSKGGLSTLNRELAIQLAKFPEVEITFFLPRCSEEEKNQALSQNVKVVEAVPHPGFEELDWLSFPPKDLQIDVVVGHGIKLGHQAQVIRKFKNCQWVQMVHTDPEERGMFKTYDKPISKGEEKQKTEVRLCEMADLVIGVGPKLSEAFRSYLRGFQEVRRVHDFTPGVFEEFVSAKQSHDEQKHFTVLVFGRREDEDFELKGFDIAARAISKLSDTHLLFVGAPVGNHEEIARRLSECGVPKRCLRVRRSVQSREELKRLFQEVDLVLMPSRTEGFGLTGLEALSAGLPVLVSKNSGFGEALYKVPFGSSFVIDSEDPEEWAAAIKEVWNKDRQGRLGEAEILRTFYGKKYNWAKQSRDLLDKMISIVHDSSSTPSKEEQVMNITLTTAAGVWNTTVSNQLEIELAKNPRVNVYGIVPRSIQEQRDLAKKLNIELVNAKKIYFPEKELIAYLPDNLNVDILITHSYEHDIAKQAQYIKETKNCKWVHVVHTIGAELASYKQKASSTDAANPDWLSDHELQVALCEEADIGIAIGPKVADAFKVALRHCGKHKDVITMTPGIIHDLAGFQTVCEGREKFHVMISATFPSKYFKVKGCDIAAKAITLLQDLSYNLTFVVLPNDDAEVLRSQLKGLISFSQFTVKHVPRSTENWRKQLCQVDLVILPSAEGFGTSCVRAISAGVPVLSSGNSGFGMALKKLPSGKMHVLDSENPWDWADKISEIRAKEPTQLALEVKQLQEEYMRYYRWKDQCDKLVDILMKIVPSKEDSQKVGVEHTEKITQAVTYAESRMQQLEIKNLREQEHDTVDEGDENPDSRMGQENEKCVESEVDKLHMPHQEEGVGVIKTSVKGAGVTDQKYDSFAQKNIAHHADDGGVSPQTKRSRLSTNVKSIPYALLGRICLKLNTTSDLLFNDFRMLGELMEIDRDYIEFCAQPRNPNPTHQILRRWCRKTREPTVEKLIEMLKNEYMQRMDVVEILEDWVEKGDSK